MTQEAKIIGFLGGATVLIVIGAAISMGKNSPEQTQVADQALLIRSNSNKISSTSANVTLVEFGDYQCPSCGAAHPYVKQILADDKEKITFVYRHYPLPQHKNARLAAEAAEAAGEQGKYWEMHDMLFENQNTWAEDNNALEIFARYANKLGLDANKFKQSVESNKFADKIAQDQSDGNALNVNSTPTFFINGQKYIGGFNDLKSAVEKAIRK